jgi:AcrR family transcriptional regulator
MAAMPRQVRLRTRRPSSSAARVAGRERRRRRILDAAAERFATLGFAKSSVDEIASAAGVSKGLIYDHYPSKEALLDAVWHELVERWTAATLRTKLADGDIAASIGAALRASIRFVEADPLLHRILAQDPGSLMPNGREGIAAFARLYRSMLEPVLARGRRKGELRRDLDVAHTAEAIWCIHHALIRELFVGVGRAPRADAEEVVESALALVVQGLLA